MLSALLGKPRKKAGPWDDRWYDGYWPGGGSRTQAGVHVNEDLALTYAAVWCATRVLTEGIGNLPLTLDRIDPNHEPEAVDHWANTLVQSPNPDMGGMVFRQGRIHHQVNWGNGFAEIEREVVGDPRSPVLALWPIHPSRVRPVTEKEQLRRGYRYLVKNDDNTHVPMRADEMLHVPGAISEDGIWGKGVISHARETVGFGIATERHGATQFGGGNMPRAALMADGMRDPDARRQFRQEWRDLHGHCDAAEIAIIPKDGNLVPLGFSNEDAQFLGVRQFNTVVIAQWYKLPPFVLAHLLHAIKSNIEQQSIELVVSGLMPWACLIEEQLGMKLLTPEERRVYRFRHDFSGLLRGDLKNRMDAWRAALEWGIVTHNQVARKEGLPSLGAAGDQHFHPANMTTVERTHAGLPPPGAKAKESGGASSGEKGGRPSGSAALNGHPRAEVNGRAAGGVPAALGEDVQGAALEAGHRRPHAPDDAGGAAAARGGSANAGAVEGVEVADEGGRDGVSAVTETGGTCLEAAARGQSGGENPARAILVDAFSKMFRKEATAAGREARVTMTTARYEEWLDQYYAKHQWQMADAITQGLLAAGGRFQPEVLAGRLAEESKATLRGLRGKTLTQVRAALASWPTERAEALADKILGES